MRLAPLLLLIALSLRPGCALAPPRAPDAVPERLLDAAEAEALAEASSDPLLDTLPLLSLAWAYREAGLPARLGRLRLAAQLALPAGAPARATLAHLAGDERGFVAELRSATAHRPIWMNRNISVAIPAHVIIPAILAIRGCRDAVPERLLETCGDLLRACERPAALEVPARADPSATAAAIESLLARHAGGQPSAAYLVHLLRDAPWCRPDASGRAHP